MSLAKSYRLRCEADQMLMDRLYATVPGSEEYRAKLLATRPARDAQTSGCWYFSGTEQYSAAQARAHAKATGWKRHSEQRPIYPGATDTTKKTYDLCPTCVDRIDLCS